MRRPTDTRRILARALIALACSLAVAAGALPAAASTPAATSSGVMASDRTVTGVPRSAANTRISDVLDTRSVSKQLGKRFTMTVWDAASGSYVYQRRAGASLRGASTTKVLTSVAALASLGPDHLFPTTVRAGATPDEVVLVAGGDPLLTSNDLRALATTTATALGAAPVPPDPTRTITVRADSSLFTGSGRSRGWPSSYLPRQVRPVGAFARDDRKVRDATGDAGAYFAKALRAQGIAAAYAGEAIAAPDSATLAAIPGHSVGEAVSHALLVSDNDTAEMLFRHVALARGLPGTWAGARQAVTDTLRDVQVPLEGVRIIDGSGLSLEGRLTAGALTSALARAIAPDHPELAGLRGWLPVAGRTGTLDAGNRRFTSKPARCAAGLIQAKTGTVADAIALAGYATGADGQTKVFVSIVNARPTRYSRAATRAAVDRVTSSVTGCW